MSEVKRYDFQTQGHPDGFVYTTMQENKGGEYVTYEDFAALQQKLDAAEEEAEAYKAFAEQDYFGNLVIHARARASKAMSKFPQPNYVLTKVAEESGELVKAGVHFAEGRETWGAVEQEAIDTIAMIIRLMTEGDEVIGLFPPQLRAGKDGE